MADRVEQLEERVEELEKVILGFQHALQPFLEKSWTQTAELVLHNMGKVTESYRPPSSSLE